LGFGALFQIAAALVAPPSTPAPVLPGLTAREKAALVVVSGLPAPRGVAGVLVQEWSRNERRPRGVITFADQEGGVASTFDELPPRQAASSFHTRRATRAAGFETGKALAAEGIYVDLAPVLDLEGGPLGSRHFASSARALDFAYGLAAGGAASCVKHFPGLGSAAVSTDESPHVRARLVRREVRSFRRAIRLNVRCVMVGHAFYPRFGRLRASFSPAAYRMLHGMGLEGVAITDSLSVFGSRYAVVAARFAARAGADLLLFTNGRDAGRAIRALVPMARRGLLDEQVARVLAFRRWLGVPRP
jgi:beta-N-acetylhexosaminidase